MPVEIFCSKPLTAMKPMSRPLPTWMYSQYSTPPPRRIALKPPKMSSDTWSVFAAFDTPPLDIAHTLSHTAGWP